MTKRKRDAADLEWLLDDCVHRAFVDGYCLARVEDDGEWSARLGIILWASGRERSIGDAKQAVADTLRRWGQL